MSRDETGLSVGDGRAPPCTATKLLGQDRNGVHDFEGKIRATCVNNMTSA